MDIEKIITSADMAQIYGSKSSRDWYIDYSEMLKGIRASKYSFVGQVDEGASPVIAYIDYSRWVAKCNSCPRINYVDPNWPNFYCFGCGCGGSCMAVPVIFPQNWREIEAALLSRPLINPNKDPKNMLDNALYSKPVLGLKHNWRGEPLSELLQANIEKGIT